MLKEMSELELYLTPEMGVYKSLITSGFIYFIFKQDLIQKMIVLEELLQFSILGEEQDGMNSEEAHGKNY